MSTRVSHIGDEWWWCRDSSLHKIADSLSETFIAIVDDFLPLEELHCVQAEVPNDTGVVYTTQKPY